MAPTATYTKLRDGSWGIRVSGSSIANGARVTVTKKSGETKTETVSRVIWTGNGIALCSISGATTRRYSHGYASDEMVRCRHCGKRTLQGDDWCMVCGRADYER